jgi:hypothetical protein
VHSVRHCSPCWTKPDQSQVANDGHGHCGSLKPAVIAQVAIDTYRLARCAKTHTPIDIAAFAGRAVTRPANGVRGPSPPEDE